MNIHNFEVITTRSKAQRDSMFQDFKQNGTKLEKQAVKFSGNEFEKIAETEDEVTGRWISNWSVAYPRS